MRRRSVHGRVGRDRGERAVLRDPGDPAVHRRTSSRSAMRGGARSTACRRSSGTCSSGRTARARRSSRRSTTAEARALVDRALITFPVSTEQILHPERWPHDTPQPVDVPDLGPALGAGWRDLDVMTVGEAWLRLMLELRLDAGEAEPAAAGWDGGLYRAWTDGSRTAVVLRTVWDTPEDAQQFADAMRGVDRAIRRSSRRRRRARRRGLRERRVDARRPSGRRSKLPRSRSRGFRRLAAPSPTSPEACGDQVRLRLLRRQQGHEGPARRQGRQPRRDDEHGPAGPAGVHDHDRGVPDLPGARRRAAGDAPGGRRASRPTSRRPMGKQPGRPRRPAARLRALRREVLDARA